MRPSGQKSIDNEEIYYGGTVMLKDANNAHNG